MCSISGRLPLQVQTLGGFKRSKNPYAKLKRHSLTWGRQSGRRPTPLDSSETYLAMQTGTVDAQENIILSSYANAMQEVSKSIVMTDHMITSQSGVCLMVINGRI